MIERLEPCWVLHRRPYGDSALIVDLYSHAHGRVGVVARGVRRQSNPAHGLLQPFNPLLAGWRGRGELFTLDQVERAGESPTLVGNALVCGLYINELLMRLSPRGLPQPELFERYSLSVAALVDQAPGPVLRLFERDLLLALDGELLLDFEADGMTPIEAGREYCYRPASGAHRVDGHCDGLTVSGGALLALAAGEPQPGAQDDQLKALMRTLLTGHLGAKPLNSRKLFRRGGDPSKP